jgi:RNA polymerase sigma factor (TIGR02999 family)
MAAPRTSSSAPEAVDRLLQEVRSGNRQAFDRLFSLVYEELRRLAGQQRRRWTGDPSLNTTALVHEAYVRLAGPIAPTWKDEPHFLAVAAKAMRQILLDAAKRNRRAKRGGGAGRVSLHEIEATLKGSDPFDAGAEAMIALDRALRLLEQHDPRQSRIVECRFFGGMAIHDTATALGISPATVKRGWAMAQAWLYREMSGSPEDA